MRYPADRIVPRSQVDELLDHDDRRRQLHLLHLLLTDADGYITVEDLDTTAPELLGLGTAVVRAHDRDHVVISYRPADPTAGSIERQRRRRIK